MPIDDKYEQLEKQHPEEAPDNLAKLLIKAMGTVEPISGLANTVLEHFSHRRALERLNVYLRHTVKDLKGHEERLEELERDRGFLETLIIGAEHTVRSANEERIERFGRIVGRTAVSNNPNWEETAGFIHDLYQLAEADIVALKTIGDFYVQLVAPSFEIGSGESEQMVRQEIEPINQKLLEHLTDLKITQDEFFSRCYRLNGVGLAVRVDQWGGIRLSAQRQFFRPTERGKRLLGLLFRE